eukprot:8105134-Ditylum_brightwellii.AAC.1
MSTASKPVQNEGTEQETSPSETSNPLLEDEKQEENKYDKLDWKVNLGYCTYEILEQTLHHTTQYFPNRIESENHAYPQQYCQKHLFPLYLCRLKGQMFAGNLKCQMVTPTSAGRWAPQMNYSPTTPRFRWGSSSPILTGRT